MLGLPEKIFLYLVRAAGVFLLHSSGFMDLTDELKSHFPMFEDTLDYAGYFPHFYACAMVGRY